MIFDWQDEFVKKVTKLHSNSTPILIMKEIGFYDINWCRWLVMWFIEAKGEELFCFNAEVYDYYGNFESKDMDVAKKRVIYDLKDIIKDKSFDIKNLVTPTIASCEKLKPLNIQKSLEKAEHINIFEIPLSELNK